MEFVQTELDGDLPKARHAHETVVVRDRPASLGGEFRCVLAPPKEGMGVEQNRQLHILREIADRRIEIRGHPDALAGAGSPHLRA